VKVESPIAATGVGRPVNILGLSAFYHDSSACLVRDGRIIAAAQEERFTRKKHDPAFPKNAVDYCLREGGIQISDVDYVAFYEKPFLKFDRILHSYLAYVPSGLKSFLMAIPLWVLYEITVAVAWYWDQKDRVKARWRLLQVFSGIVLVALLIWAGVKYGWPWLHQHWLR